LDCKRACCEALDYAERIWREIMPDLDDRLLSQVLADRSAEDTAIACMQDDYAEALKREQTLRTQAEAERDAVLSSTGWRIAAPLRRVVDRVRQIQIFR
jgi:hypothetical protein